MKDKLVKHNFKGLHSRKRRIGVGSIAFASLLAAILIPTYISSQKASEKASLAQEPEEQEVELDEAVEDDLLNYE